MVDGVRHTYQYVGGLLMHEIRGNDAFSYDYDAYGHLSCIRYMWADGSCWKFYVACNSRGDVTTIYAGDGTLRAKYTYDSWGNTLSIIDRYGNDIVALGDESIAADNIGALNRIRYRGYYYDFESGLYSLQSRYYDPQVKRFLNADGYVSTGQGILGTNMFAYCGNNPVNRVDGTGQWWLIAAVVVVAVSLTVTLSGCDDAVESSSSPRRDLVNANSLLDKSAEELSALNRNSYNCYGNGIGKQINTDPTGYQRGDSTRKTFESVKKDLGGDANVRELNSIDDPIGDDEFKVAIKCGPTDYHFIRQLNDGSWYNKSGTTTGLPIPQNYIVNGLYGNGYWYGYSVEFGLSEPIYTYETIYFAVKVGWDE